jgi:DNA-binding transcriptional ArsR family regulator
MSVTQASEQSEQPKRLDSRSLRGLAHPLRIRILSTLRLDGPSTATRLARQFGQDSGNISWHLRQLAVHGFIAEDAARGTRRERWWYALHPANRLDLASFTADAGAEGPIGVYLRQALEQYFERAAAFLAEDWSGEWQQASEFSGWQIELSPADLRTLNDELKAVVARHQADARRSRPSAADTAPVHIQLQTFPRHKPLP